MGQRSASSLAERLPRSPGRGLYALIAGILAGILIFSALLTLNNAHAERAERLARLSEAAKGLSALIDREVETSRGLLVGLLGSPALQAGDMKTFHAQLQRTPHAKGMALVASDSERQLANSLVPYSTPLPMLSEFTPQPGFLERLEDPGFHVSSRVYGRIAKTSTTVVSIKVPGPDGRLRYILSAAMNSARLLDVLSAAALPQDAGLLVIDAMGQDIARQDSAASTLTEERLFKQVDVAPGTFVQANGTFERDDRFTAYARSALTEWTAAVTLPSVVINAPVTTALRNIGWFALVLSGALLGLVAVLRRRVEAPFSAMRSGLVQAQDQLGELREASRDLLRDEHRRIARELHDTTAQRLVAADLQLSALQMSGQSQAAETHIGNVQTLIEQSLRELRSFSFVLRPAALENRAFGPALSDLVLGFARRAGLQGSADISEGTEAISAGNRDILYRITQEALINIHRHSGAGHVALRLAPEAGRWTLTVRDDGRGGIRYPGASGQSASADAGGLGIEGMAKALSDVGGTLDVRDTGQGTEVCALLPPDPDDTPGNAPDARSLPGALAVG